MVFINNLIYIDRLSIVMLCLIGFVSLVITSFSLRYLDGDRRRSIVLLQIAGLITSASIMVSSDHIALFVASWMGGNTLLASLIQHKQAWSASKHSSILARRNFRLGALFLSSAFALLFMVTGETSIQSILHSNIQEPYRLLTCTMIVVTAMTQSALWPFHKWLLSSLNSPTPVSAMMHAGIVNGGGFLLVRFSPLLSQSPLLMKVLFISGLASALVGTLWKLIQSDVKRMLACSTMGQMGFMVAQCGLGLFPAAITHLCWHGLFKAYLFLGSGSAVRDKRVSSTKLSSTSEGLIGLLCGSLSVLSFSTTTKISIASFDTRQTLLLVTLLAGTQCAVTVLQQCTTLRFLLASGCALLLGVIYGTSFLLIEHYLDSSELLHPQPIGWIYGTGIALLIAAWFFMLILQAHHFRVFRGWISHAYVIALNASQPHPNTVTTHRNEYRF